MFIRLALITLFMTVTALSQTPPIEPGVSHDLAKWRARHYSDVRYKLNLTLEKMSPVLKGTIEIRVKVGESGRKGEGETGTQAPSPANAGSSGVGVPQIILDWRKIRGSESLSTISNVSINGVSVATNSPPANAGGSDKTAALTYGESNEHLIFRDGVVAGENVIKLDFTSPILTSGSAITRYVDKEDGAEYVYSLFVPSDGSTAFPVFDQPDLKARFSLGILAPDGWRVVSNENSFNLGSAARIRNEQTGEVSEVPHEKGKSYFDFFETKPISTYVFAFAAGPWERVSSPTVKEGAVQPRSGTAPSLTVGLRTPETSVYVRKSQAAKFKPHAAEVFRLNREGIKFLETYFDYKFPFPKYDIVLIPEFPFGGMEHAGATFLREASVIFPQEPTKNDYISRANVIFHEAAHQWFGDTVTMKWFDDLWLKEGFAEFMAYKTLEKVMPEYNAWKVFYERNKQAAYLTDSTKGTTPIYQEIANLNSAKSAYGNIVYRKAPSFLKQAEFYLGPDKFQTAVRAFLKKHEYANAGWEDLVKEFETASKQNLTVWANSWIRQRGVPRIYQKRTESKNGVLTGYELMQVDALGDSQGWYLKYNLLEIFSNGTKGVTPISFESLISRKGDNYDLKCEDCFVTSAMGFEFTRETRKADFLFPNYQDYGYGIFLLDDKSRDYVLKNIGSEKDDFLRTMMWGSLWDSVREAELDPKDYVELVIKVLSSNFSWPDAAKKPAKAGTQNGETDESTIATLLNRVSTAMRYYMPADAERVSSPHVSKGSTQPKSNADITRTDTLQTRLEALLIDRMQRAPTPGQRITYYRAFLTLASSDNARNALKQILAGPLKGNPRITPTAPLANDGLPTLRTKDKFDIVTRLMVLGDTDAPRLLAQLEKTETSDDAKRYAYAALAGMATPENKAKYWSDFVTHNDISESWIEAAFVPFNSTSHADLTLPYLERALAELPNLKRSRKIFFVNGWLGAFIGGQRDQKALDIINKFLADDPNLDKDLRLKILENSDLIERAVRIREKFKSN